MHGCQGCSCHLYAAANRPHLLLIRAACNKRLSDWCADLLPAFTDHVQIAAWVGTRANGALAGHWQEDKASCRCTANRSHASGCRKQTCFPYILGAAQRLLIPQSIYLWQICSQRIFGISERESCIYIRRNGFHRKAFHRVAWHSRNHGLSCPSERESCILG